MSISSSWTHGNALTIESPVHLSPDGEPNGWLVQTAVGWGAHVTNEGHAVVSWLHLPISTVYPEANLFERFELLRVCLLFSCTDAVIDSVHVYDGNVPVQGFNGVALQGKFLSKGARNTFTLSTPYRVRTGIGLSFLYKGLIGTGGGGTIPHGQLVVVAAGAEFRTGNIVLAAVARRVSRLFP